VDKAPRSAEARGNEQGGAQARGLAEAGQEYLREFFYDPEEEGGASDLLPVLVSDVEAGEPAEAPQALDEFLAFRLNAEDYAIEIGSVHEIIRPTSITEVPRSPKAILGVISLRGEALPVFDLQRLLGTEGKGTTLHPPQSARVVILRTSRGLAGIMVDAVEQVVRLPHGSIEATPRGLAASHGGALLKGIGRWQGRLLAILDSTELLHPDRRG
jgi:purine-binding chemotaxis protein CheW